VLIAVMLGILIIGDPGRIDRDKTWLRVLTGSLIGLITAVNAVAAVRLLGGIIRMAPFSDDANVLLAGRGPKLMMMAEEAVSLVVVARAVNILHLPQAAAGRAGRRHPAGRPGPLPVPCGNS
jgi:hypothetical protein